MGYGTVVRYGGAVVLRYGTVVRYGGAVVLKYGTFVRYKVVRYSYGGTVTVVRYGHATCGMVRGAIGWCGGFDVWYDGAVSGHSDFGVKVACEAFLKFDTLTPSKTTRFAASPIDTAKPERSQRLKRRHMGASKRAFRARLPSILTR